MNLLNKLILSPFAILNEMAFHVRNIATAKAKTAFSRGAAIVTNNKENRVTLYTMKYNAADYNSAKVMSYPANIKFEI